MAVLDVLLGKRLATSDERGEQVGPTAGIPIFGLDALSSAAYGPEAALTLLLPLGLLGVRYILPITIAIIILLTIVYFSYRQTISAYPGGGGSYTVASENLGTYPGLFADRLHSYRGGGHFGGRRSARLGRAEPAAAHAGDLLGHSRSHHVCESARRSRSRCLIHGADVSLLGFPTLGHLVRHDQDGPGGRPSPSRRVRAFREPTVKNAQRTLTIIIGFLIVLLAGIAYLVRAYGIAATDPGQPGYQSVLSMLIGAVSGRGWFYYVAIGSVLLILSLSANTAFADFPRLCRAVAHNNFLPHNFGFRGRRLVYTHGIMALAVLTGVLLIIFGGVTDRLIPLYAIGAFLAFTLSQAGMVGHWLRQRGKGWVHSTFVNGLGALATGVTLMVVLVAKFTAGAWMSALIIVGLVGIMTWVRHHYNAVAEEIRCLSPVQTSRINSPIVVVPIQTWNLVAQRALEFGLTLSNDIRALHVTAEDETDVLREEWGPMVEEPLKKAGRKPPELIYLESPYRVVLKPTLDYVLQAEREHPETQIAIIVPELVEKHWYHYPLHNQRAEILKALLLYYGSRRIVLINVPWYLNA